LKVILVIFYFVCAADARSVSDSWVCCWDVIWWE